MPARVCGREYAGACLRPRASEQVYAGACMGARVRGRVYAGACTRARGCERVYAAACMRPDVRRRVYASACMRLRPCEQVYVGACLRPRASEPLYASACMGARVCGRVCLRPRVCGRVYAPACMRLGPYDSVDASTCMRRHQPRRGCASVCMRRSGCGRVYAGPRTAAACMRARVRRRVDASACMRPLACGRVCGRVYASALSRRVCMRPGLCEPCREGKQCTPSRSSPILLADESGRDTLSAKSTLPRDDEWRQAGSALVSFSNIRRKSRVRVPSICSVRRMRPGVLFTTPFPTTTTPGGGHGERHVNADPLDGTLVVVVPSSRLLLYRQEEVLLEGVVAPCRPAMFSLHALSLLVACNISAYGLPS